MAVFPPHDQTPRAISFRLACFRTSTREARLPVRVRHTPLSSAVWLAALLAMLLLGIGGAVHGAAAQTPPASAGKDPLYRFSLHLDTRAHTIAGVMKLELDPGDSRAGGELLFHLPPNRFLEKDGRGRRRNTDSLPFAGGFSGANGGDPLEPAGFSPGHIAILAVEDEDGRPLSFSFEDNPAIPDGYSIRKALLRVQPGTMGNPHAIVIRFKTYLPHRYWEGWSEDGILAEQWHPVLANRRDGKWDRGVFSPRGGRFQAGISVDREGRLFLGRAWRVEVSPKIPFRMPLTDMPLRSLPLVFLPLPKWRAMHDYDLSLYSFYNRGHERVGDLSLSIAAEFIAFVRERYRLPPPDTRIALVEAPLPSGDIRIVGSIVLIPEEYFRTSPLLDRVFLAQLSRAVAQVWFGEAVWSDRDRQSWLHLGIPGFLALDFFQSVYGWNAGIHNIVDWLQPKYREHYFERRVRDLIRGEKDAPLMISLTGYPLRDPALLSAHNKGPLVMRSLSHLVGREAFAKALNALYYKHRFTEVTAATFRRELSVISGRDLTPFFDHWFRGTPRIDFSIEDWQEENTGDGYRIQVRVRREGPPPLPVDVRITTESGATETQRWRGNSESALLTFETDDPVAIIAMDPEEHWLEVDRRNNYSEILYRVRPIFDWPKQRELLVALRGTAGGNSIDGNYLGLGVNLHLNENNNLVVIPIYGERTGLVNYVAFWEWRQFLLPPLSLRVTLTKLGGTTLQALGFAYRLVDNDQYALTPGIEFRWETVEPVGFIDNGNPVFQPFARSNNIGYLLDFAKKPGLLYANNFSLRITDSHPSYGSDFDFTTLRTQFDQILTPGSSHFIKFGLIRGATEGTPPLQKRHELGGPHVLRGYPRIVELSNEEFAAARLDYGLIVSRGIYGEAAQIRRVTGYLFGDVGRGWNNGESRNERPQRQDLGVGLELEINLVRLAQFPLRVDVAYPINDPEYKGPQIILFGILNF